MVCLFEGHAYAGENRSRYLVTDDGIYLYESLEVSREDVRRRAKDPNKD